MHKRSHEFSKKTRLKKIVLILISSYIKTGWIECTLCVLYKNWDLLSHSTQSYWIVVLFIYNIHIYIA